VARDEDRLDCFGRGLDNALYHTFWNGSKWHGWESLGGILTSDPAVVVRDPDHIDCFVRGTDNALYHKFWNGSKWHGWEGLGGSLTSNIVSVIRAGGNIDCFALGEDKALWHIYWDGHKWHSWESLGGEFQGNPTVVASWSMLHCFAVHTNQSMWQRTWDGSSWSPWQNLGHQFASTVAAVEWPISRWACAAIGNNKELYYASNQAPKTFKSVGGQSTGNVAMVVRGESRVDCFARGADNALWHIYGDPDPPESSNPGTGNPGGNGDPGGNKGPAQLVFNLNASTGVTKLNSVSWQVTGPGFNQDINGAITGKHAGGSATVPSNGLGTWNIGCTADFSFDYTDDVSTHKGSTTLTSAIAKIDWTALNGAKLVVTFAIEFHAPTAGGSGEVFTLVKK
jgi:hypothetical protein